MILYPAIDLKEGAVVRLIQGRMEDATVFPNAPAVQAKAWADAGFDWVHVVDLDGAFAGAPKNAEAVAAIVEAVDMPVQLGGGIRDVARVAYWLEAGVKRVILGTIAVRDPQVVKDAAAAYPGCVAVGVDVRGGQVAVEGWAETTSLTAVELAKRFEDAGVAALIVTDIDRDGLNEGVNVDLTGEVADAVDIPVIASGGMASVANIAALKARAGTPIAGAVIGRALYDGRIDPAEALAAASS